MARTELDHLTRRVAAYFRRRAADFGLRPDAVEARYILNWGGFVNPSFTLTDGQTTYHLKLTDDEETLDQLAWWQELNDILVEKYHAPRILASVEIPRTQYSGLLFTHIHGEHADLASQPKVLRGVTDMLTRLHGDTDLAQVLLGDEESPPTCSDYFLSVYIDRFDEDLLSVAGDLPPFVPLSLLDWMQGETRELEGLARDLPAFQHPAASPTHGDLWPNNILVTPDGSWYIIDWDDLDLGDPALEWSILLGPLWQAGHLTREEVDSLLPVSEEDFRQRFDLCIRAMVLDQVIDTLADWVESGFAPELQAVVQAEKERKHKEGLAFYRELWGS